MKSAWVIGTKGQPTRYAVYCENGDLERADAIKLAVHLLSMAKATSEEIAAARRTAKARAQMAGGFVSAADLGMLYTLLADGTFERVRADDREWVAHDGEALVIVRLVVVPDARDSAADFDARDRSLGDRKPGEGS